MAVYYDTIYIRIFKTVKYIFKKLLYKIYQSPLYYSNPKNRILEASSYVTNKSNNKRSVLLWTTHKTASTFLGKALREISKNSNYKHFDYASSIWYMGDNIAIEDPT